PLPAATGLQGKVHRAGDQWHVLRLLRLDSDGSGFRRGSKRPTPPLRQLRKVPLLDRLTGLPSNSPGYQSSTRSPGAVENHLVGSTDFVSHHELNVVQAGG